MLLEEKLAPYIDAVKDGIIQENWILVTSGALMLPDICASLTEEDGKSKRSKYIEWFDEYCSGFKFKTYIYDLDEINNIHDLKDRSKKEIRAKENGEYKVKEHIYFNGLLAYALRCSFLHNGSGQVANQPVHVKALKKYNNDLKENETLGANKIILDASVENKVISQFEDVIYLNPKNFAEEVIEGVYRWASKEREDEYVLNNIENFIEIKVQ